MSIIRKFLKDETGLELSEYAVGAALIAIGCVTLFSDLGTAIGSKISQLKSSLN
ncbi:MAG: Flp family type IVb pilin [Blastocatellales bacterium]